MVPAYGDDDRMMPCAQPSSASLADRSPRVNSCQKAAPDKAFKLPEDPDLEATFQALLHDFRNLVKAHFQPEQVRSNAAGFTFGKKIF